MNWLHTATTVFHVLVATAIVALVLLQRGKGADAGAGFGAGASGTVFGARGSGSFMSRMTAVLAAVFIATSLGLAYMGGNQPDAPQSVIERVQLPGSQTNDAGQLFDAPPSLGDEPAAPAAAEEQGSEGDTSRE